MLSFKSFKELQSEVSLLLENKLIDDYWLKISYDDFLYLVKTNKLKNKKNILFVTKSSDHSSIYNDIYEFPVSIYFDKMKLYQLIIDKNYKSSLDKEDNENNINEEIETANDNFDEIDTMDDSNLDVSSDDLLNDSELQNNNKEDNSEDNNLKDDTDKNDKSIEKTIDEFPDEISVNEKELDINPKDIIKIIEIDLERINHLLDKEVVNISKMLNISRSIKNKSYKESRDKISEKFKSIASDFSSLNNIVINFIE